MCVKVVANHRWDVFLRHGIFLPCDLYLLLSFFPRVISAVGDWMSTMVLP